LPGAHRSGGRRFKKTAAEGDSSRYSITIDKPVADADIGKDYTFPSNK
jgi:hypothetical protein